jgi:PadR family transcriptional regulator PadR
MIMDITGETLRGHTDAIILSILKNGDNYGYNINMLIEKVSNGAMKLTEATLYTSFKRLESNAYILSYWKDGLNGTKRKYYTITDSGRSFLIEQIESYFKAREILNYFYGGANEKEN